MGLLNLQSEQDCFYEMLTCHVSSVAPFSHRQAGFVGATQKGKTD